MAILTFKYISIFSALLPTIWSSSSVEYTDSRIGPFEMIVKEIGRCDDNGANTILYDSTRIVKVGRHKYQYSTNFTTLVTIDDSFEGMIYGSVWGNGGWKPHSIVFDFKPCTNPKKYFPSLFKAMMAAMGVNGCPLPAGTFHISNLEMSSVSTKDIPVFPYGTYRLDVTLKKNNTLQGCFRVFYDIIPKSARKNKPKRN